MSITLNELLEELNQKDENMVNIINTLFDIAMFDDGKFAGWETGGVKAHGGTKNVQKDLEKLREYLKKHGCHDEEKMFFVIFSVGEGEVETEKELKQTIEDVKNMKNL